MQHLATVGQRRDGVERERQVSFFLRVPNCRGQRHDSLRLCTYSVRFFRHTSRTRQVFGTDRTMASMSPCLGRVLLEYGRWHLTIAVVVGGGLGGGGFRCALWGLVRGSFCSWCLLVRFVSACCVCLFVFVFAFACLLLGSGGSATSVSYTCVKHVPGICWS